MLIPKNLSDGTLTLRPQGDIVTQNAAAIVADLTDALNTSGLGAVNLSLAEVNMVDSRGIGVIVGLHKTCKARGIAFSVSDLSRELSDLFTLMRLNELFPTVPTRG